VRVGFVHDRPGADWGVGFRDSLRLEVARILQVDYTVEMPADLERTADGTTAGVQAELESLLADKQVDLIVASGPLGTLVASQLPDLARPVIGSWVLDAEVQGIPYQDGKSGHPNYTYITVGNLLSADMAALDLMLDYHHLTVVGSAGWVRALPGDGSALAKFHSAKTSFVVGDGTVESVLDKLPADADAIYLMPMVDMSSAQVTSLLAAFSDRKLPVLSLVDEPEVRAGALLGAAPADWRRRMYRRVALVAAKIMSGENPADIPVMMTRDDRIFYNLQTAEKIGISPPFEILIEAVLIGEMAPEGIEPIDLLETMTTAQANNRDIAAAERAVQAGHYQVNVSKGNLLPQIDLGLNGVLIDEDSANVFPGVSEQTLAGSASFTQVLYSDKAWAGYSIEKHRQEARVGNMEQVRLDVGLEAATAYMDVLRAQTKLQVQRQNLAFSRSNRERAEVRVSVGDANKSELYRWESKIADEQSILMRAVIALRLARLELNRVLFRPLEESLQLENTTLNDQYRTLVSPRVDRFTLNADGLEILRDFLVEKGLVSSPELSQYDALILATERENTAANRSFWAPDLGLAGGVNHVFARGGEGVAEDDPDKINDTTWNLRAFLSLPLLEGGSRFAETKRTTEETYRLLRGREATAQRIEQNVRNAVFQVAGSRLAIDLSRKAAEAARNNLEIVADNYTMGLVSLVDLLDAQTNSFTADLAAIDAVNDYLVDLMRVERAVGQFTFFVPEEEQAAWIEELEAYEETRP
jgi:outer membrane protein TolC